MSRCAKTVFFGLIVLLFALSPTCLATVNEANLDAFYLSVSLNDPYNADLLVRTPIKIDAPFRITVENGDVKTTISGTVGASVDQSYQMTLTVTEWASATSNITGTSDLRLELDKPSSYGVVSSFVYLRTVTLSKKVHSQSATPNKSLDASRDSVFLMKFL
jgi:hypothetical protein